MKTWDQLTKDEQERIVKERIAGHVQFLVEYGPSVIGVAGDPLYTRVDKIFKDMERMQTPWFVGDSIYDDPILMNWMTETAWSDLSGGLFFFLEPGEVAMYIPPESIEDGR